jgi:hypothetical protein
LRGALHRLLGIDAPELDFPVGSSPVSQDPVLAKLPKTNAWKSLPQALRDYLAPRLEGAGIRQREWGLAAKFAFEKIKQEWLHLGEMKSERDIFIASGEEVFDRYGRMLLGRRTAKRNRNRRFRSGP